MFRLNLDQNDINFINAAAIEMPFKQAAPFINKINAQIQESIRQDQEATKTQEDLKTQEARMKSAEESN